VSRARRPPTATTGVEDRGSARKPLVDAVRDWAALLYTPVLTAYAVWITALLVWAYPWSKQTEPLRLNFLGWALIAALCLVGLGTLFYQRRPAPHIRAKGGMVELELWEGEARPPGAASGSEAGEERPAPEGRGRGRRGPGLSTGGSGRCTHSTPSTCG
jgi:hypothetical protein